MNPVVAVILAISALWSGCLIVLGISRIFPPRPASEMPCGHRRNPHQFGMWEVWGKLESFDTKRVVGIVQKRVCKRCGYQELDKQQMFG